MKSWLFMVLAFAAPSATAAELADASAALALSDRIMQVAAKGDVRSALELGRPYIVIPHSEFDAMLGQAELQLPIIAARFGNPLATAFARVSALQSSW